MKKRRYPRVQTDFPIRYREILASTPRYKGVQLKDISLGGLRFQTETFLPRDMNIIFEVPLPEVEKPLRAISRVTWTRRIPAGERYEVGSQFVELLPTEKKHLEHFLSSQPRARA